MARRKQERLVHFVRLTRDPSWTWHLLRLTPEVLKRKTVCDIEAGILAEETPFPPSIGSMTRRCRVCFDKSDQLLNDEQQEQLAQA